MLWQARAGASGAKRRMLRTVVGGNRRDIGLSGVALVSLAEAREKALAMCKHARAGGDPLADRRRERRVVPTFEEATDTVHAEHAAGWKKGKHAAQGKNTQAEYAFPVLGRRRSA